MKIHVILPAALLALSLAACHSEPAKPKPQPTGEVWRSWKTPDGVLHTEKVRDLTPEEAAGPVTTTITASKKN
jgi:hypothetical protein